MSRSFTYSNVRPPNVSDVVFTDRTAAKRKPRDWKPYAPETATRPQSRITQLPKPGPKAIEGRDAAQYHPQSRILPPPGGAKERIIARIEMPAEQAAAPEPPRNGTSEAQRAALDNIVDIAILRIESDGSVIVGLRTVDTASLTELTALSMHLADLQGRPLTTLLPMQQDLLCDEDAQVTPDMCILRLEGSLATFTPKGKEDRQLDHLPYEKGWTVVIGPTGTGQSDPSVSRIFASRVRTSVTYMEVAENSIFIRIEGTHIPDRATLAETTFTVIDGKRQAKTKGIAVMIEETGNAIEFRTGTLDGDAIPDGQRDFRLLLDVRGHRWKQAYTRPDVTVDLPEMEPGAHIRDFA